MKLFDLDLLTKQFVHKANAFFSITHFCMFFHFDGDTISMEIEFCSHALCMFVPWSALCVCLSVYIARLCVYAFLCILCLYVCGVCLFVDVL
jgi:hypothetical protein